MIIDAPCLKHSQRISKEHQQEGFQIEESNIIYSSLNRNQKNLNEKLLIDGKIQSQLPYHKRGISVKISFIILIFSFIFEMILLWKAYLGAILFSYCFWDFGFLVYYEGEDKPYEGGTNQSLYQFITKNCCKMKFSSYCPDVCDLAYNLISNERWFSYGIFIRFFVLSLGYFAIFIEIRRKNILKVKKIFIVTQIFTMTCLILGTLLSLGLIGLETLEDPVQDTLAIPKQFEWGSGTYLLLLLEFISIMINTIIYCCMKPN